MTNLPSPRLAQRLRQPQILIAPGIYDALSALVAEQSNAEALYLSGASIAYTRLGRSDIGLVTMSEVADTLDAICDRINTPVIVDADNGYGNALNTQRTVRRFERHGASAIQLEDQSYPKRCGHLDGKRLVSTAEMTGKIKAACDARYDDETLIIARTDAIAVEGIAAAIDRAHAYAQAGADILFVEAPRSDAQIRQIIDSLAPHAPLLANMVEGGKTPSMTATELQTRGYKVAIFPGGLVRAQVRSMQQYFGSLLSHGSNLPMQDRMLDFEGINEIIGTRELLALGKRYGEPDE